MIILVTHVLLDQCIEGFQNALFSDWLQAFTRILHEQIIPQLEEENLGLRGELSGVKHERED
jgi:hypothetical protein